MDCPAAPTEPPWHRIDGPARPLLYLCDHASADLPPGIGLGLDPSVLGLHVAVDLGARPLCKALIALTGGTAILGRWSRLFVDLNRPADSPALAPASSDGIVVPGNAAAGPAERRMREAVHGAFHTEVARLIDACQPSLLVSVHSFTPALASEPGAARPWPVAILWNRDDRAARLALAHLSARTDLGGPVGANEPYSGQVLNYTMDRHAEARGLPYVGFEVRQDQLADAAGIARWAEILAACLTEVEAGLAGE